MRVGIERLLQAEDFIELLRELLKELLQLFHDLFYARHLPLPRVSHGASPLAVKRASKSMHCSRVSAIFASGLPLSGSRYSRSRLSLSSAGSLAAVSSRSSAGSISRLVRARSTHSSLYAKRSARRRSHSAFSSSDSFAQSQYGNRHSADLSPLTRCSRALHSLQNAPGLSLPCHLPGTRRLSS